jgi:putative transposase
VVAAQAEAGVVFHSDRGSQYASNAMRDKLIEYGMTAPMSRKGNCWDTQSTMGSSAASGLTRAGIGFMPLR